MSEQQPAGFGPARPLGESGGPGGAPGPSGAPPAPPPQPSGAPLPSLLDVRSPARQNWLALASLATTFVLTPAVMLATGNPTWAIAMSVVSVTLAQIARGAATRAAGALKKTSMWAFVLSFVMIPAWIVAFFAVSAERGWDVEAEVRFSELRVGECVQSPETTSSDDGQLTAATIDRVFCDDPHWGQAYFVTELDDGAFPGNNAVLLLAEEACLSDEAFSAIRPSKRDEAWPLLQYPIRESWGDGDRTVVCILTRYDEQPFTGSWLVDD